MTVLRFGAIIMVFIMMSVNIAGRMCAIVPTILVIDDSEFICAVIRNVFADDDINVLTAGTATKGIETVLVKCPDLILMDVALPDMDGFKACTILKSNQKSAEIPVIFITGHSDSNDTLRGFEAGAVDYISKPFNTTELKARVKSHIKIKLMSDDLKLLNESLVTALNENQRLAQIDPLTGLYNRRYGYDYMEKHLLKRTRKSSVLLMGDIDSFKSVNDRYGHLMGDNVLIAFFKAIQEMIAEKGIACRWGGEEVLIILHDLTLSDATAYGSEICKALHSIPFQSDNDSFFCSITFGAAAFDYEKSIEHSVNLADKALYRGKKQGKNRCVSAK